MHQAMMWHWKVAPKTELYSHEAAVFINDKIKLSEALELSVGVRFTGYSQAGPFTATFKMRIFKFSIR